MLDWLLGGGFELRNPLFLIAGLVAPVIYALANRLPASVTYSSLNLADAAPRSPRVRLSALPALMLALAAVCLAIAMAGPRTGDATNKTRREGIAIMLVVDRSGSMDARDFVEGDYSVSRLDAVKDALREFVLGGDSGAGRPDDLIGVVAFGTYADGIAPLTLDHGNLMAIVEDLEIARERTESATAIGEGLALAVERLRTHPARSKVIVLLTDGVNNAGEIEPLQAAELAASLGIKVYTVGAGSTGIAPMPARALDGRTVLRPSRVEIDETTLARLAERTGGRYFNAKSAEGLIETYAEIDQLERTEITEVRYLQYREHYSTFVLAALVLITLAVLAASTVLRRLP
jgi:Ca-activated chloride channel family protein